MSRNSKFKSSAGDKAPTLMDADPPLNVGAKRPYDEQSEGTLSDPYALICNSQPQICSKDVHSKGKKNCADNPWCIYGLGESKEGIWRKTDAWIDCLDIGMEPKRKSTNDKEGQSYPIGLRNLGATCYLNVLIQGLFHNRLIRDAIFSTSVKEGRDLTPVDKILGELQSTFAYLLLSDCAVYNLTKFVDLLKLNRQEQQDPLEFNSLFFEKCFDDRTIGNRGAEARVPLPDENGYCNLTATAQDDCVGASQLTISDLLCGKECYSTKCLKCKKVSNSAETSFRELALSIDGVTDLDSAIANHFAEEVMNGDNKYRCGECGDLQDASRSCAISQKPVVLFLSLRRYVYDTTTYDKKKLKTAVTFKNELLFHGDEYRLVSVLYHKGASAHGGHYVADVLDWEREQWWHCDDDTVTPVQNPALKTSPPRDPEIHVLVDEDLSMVPSADPDFEEESAGNGKAKKKEKSKAKSKGATKKASACKATPGLQSHLAAAASPVASKGPKASPKATKKSTASKSSSSSLDPYRDAYMFSYVKVAHLLSSKGTAGVEPAEGTKASVLTANERFNDKLANYSKIQSKLKEESQKRQKLYKTLFEESSPIQHDDIRLVPTPLLRQWITADRVLDKATEAEMEVVDISESNSVTDLTGDDLQPVLQVDGEPTNELDVDKEMRAFSTEPLEPYMCTEHNKPGIPPSKLCDYKIISAKAYMKIFPQSDADGTAYRCDECATQCQEDLQIFKKKTNVLQQIIHLIEMDQFEGNSVNGSERMTHAISKKWYKETKTLSDADMGSGKPAAQQKAKAKRSKGSTPIDTSINADLLCRHDNRAVGVNKGRIFMVSSSTWDAIVEALREQGNDLSKSRPMLVDEPVCEKCSNENANVKNKSKERAAELKSERSAPGLSKLLSETAAPFPAYFVDKKSPQKLLALEDPKVHSRHYLVCEDWLEQWRAYHSNGYHSPQGMINRPIPLTNTSLRCQHGLAFIPTQIAKFLNGIIDEDAEHTILGDGTPRARLVTEEQWNSLMLLYGGQQVVSEPEGTENIDQGATADQKPFEVVLENIVWTPQCCEECQMALQEMFRAQNTTFTDARLDVILLGEGEMVPGAPPLLMEGEVPERRNVRRTARKKVPNFSIFASSNDTVYEVKMKIFAALQLESAFDTCPNNQVRHSCNYPHFIIPHLLIAQFIATAVHL